MEYLDIVIFDTGRLRYFLFDISLLRPVSFYEKRPFCINSWTHPLVFNSNSKSLIRSLPSSISPCIFSIILSKKLSKPETIPLLWNLSMLGLNFLRARGTQPSYQRSHMRCWWKFHRNAAEAFHPKIKHILCNSLARMFILRTINPSKVSQRWLS